MKKIAVLSSVVGLLFGFQLWAADSPEKVIQGKWVAKKYLQFGVEDGKVVQIQNLTLKPAHFGWFMYSPKQTLEIAVSEPKEGVEKIPGSMQSDQTLLDSSCQKSPAYKEYAGCSIANNQKIDLGFRFFELDGGARSAEGVMIASWAKNGIKGITSGFTATAADYTSHLGFFGPDHLLLRVNYFRNALKKSEDAFSSKCPKRNKCYVTFLQFDRVPETKSE